MIILRWFYRCVYVGALLAVPLFFMLGVTRSFDFPKFLLFRTLMLLVLLGVAGWFLWKREARLNIGRLLSRPALIWGGLFMVIFLATVFSPQSIQSLHGTYERGQGLIQWSFYAVFFVLGLIVLSKKMIPTIIGLVVGVGSLIAFYAVLQGFGVDPFFKNFNTDFFVGREFSTLGNPDFLGQYLGPLMVLCGMLFLWVRRWPLKILTAIGFFTMGGGIVLSESRSPVFGILVALSALGLYAFIHFKKHRKKILWGAGMAAILGILILLFSPLGERFSFEAVHLRSLQSRFLIWNVAIQLILDHPILGVGPENFAIYFPEYLKPSFYVLEENINISADRAHNDFLRFGIMAGIPGMILYGWMVFWAVKYYLKTKSKDLVFHGIFLALFVYFGQNVFSFSETSHVLLFLFLWSSMILWTQKDRLESIKSSRITSVALGVFLLVMIPLTWLSTVWKPFVAEAYFTQSIYYEYMADQQGNYESLKTAIEIYPQIAYPRYQLLMRFASEVWPQSQMLRQIEGETINVMAWDAVSLSGEEDLNEARAAFEEVIALNPNYAHTQRTYGDALFRWKEYEQAIEQYEIYFELVPEFWTWCFDLKEHTEEEQKTYRVFYKNVPDFNNSLIHLLEAHRHLGHDEEVAYYESYLGCLLD